MSRRVFALVDASQFYVSCERVFRPDLDGRPVVVLSNNDGCVVARSEEVRARGVRNGVPWFQVRDLLPGAVPFSSNYPLYADFSRRVMETLATVSPDVELYSIDEAFVALPADTPAALAAWADAVHDRVRQWTRIPVRVGVAPTKTLAKVASEVARARGLAGHRATAVLAGTAGAAADALAAMPVTDVWGVGPRLGARLRAAGVTTAAGLAAMPDPSVRRLLGVVGLRTALELRGVSCLPLTRAPAARRSLTRSRSFGRRVARRDEMAEALATHAADACRALRREGLAARALQIFFHTPRHGAGPHHAASRALAFSAPTNRTPDVTALARRLLADAWPGDGRFGFGKAGVLLLDLVPADAVPRDLFLPERTATDALLAAVDRINARFTGRGTGRTRPVVRFASEGTPRGTTTESGHAWAMRQRQRSPGYTTDWRALPPVRLAPPA